LRIKGAGDKEGVQCNLSGDGEGDELTGNIPQTKPIDAYSE
jgi:hypothetical protein